MVTRNKDVAAHELEETHDHEERESQVQEQDDKEDDTTEKEEVLRVQEGAKTTHDARTIGRRSLS